MSPGPTQDRIAEGRAERERLRLWRAQRYRVKAAVYFACQQDGCSVDYGTKVANLDGSPFTPEQERTDEQLTVRCRHHRDPEPEASE